ncbi:MAG: Ig-like domain repeat protein [Phycisphaerae bacterium]
MRISGNVSGRRRQRARRDGGLREKRMMVEGLESRLLLAATLLPVADHYGLIFDATRNQLDVVGSNAVYRYDAGTGAMLSSINIPGSPGPGDITPDGHYLLLTDRSARVIHKVDLATGTDTLLNYSIGPYGGESNPNALVAVSDTTAYFTANQAGSGNYLPVHVLNIATGAVTYTTTPALTSYGGDGRVYRSPDRNSVVLDNFNGSNGPAWLYSVPQGRVVSQAAATEYSAANMTLNANATLVAESDYYRTVVRDGQFQRLQADLPGGASLLSPVFNTLYILPTNSSRLLAYDATTFQVKATFDLGETFGFNWYDPAGEGLMTTSTDGKTLYIAGGSGVRVVNVDESAFQTVSFNASAASVSQGVAVTLTATIGGGATGSVTFVNGGVTFGSATLQGGTATLTATLPSAGVFDFQAVYTATTGASLVSQTVPIVVRSSRSTLPVQNADDMVINSARNELDILCDNGDILRLNLTTGAFMPAFHIIGKPGPADVTPDGNILLIPDQGAEVIHEVNTTTGVDTQVAYVTAYGGEGTPNSIVAVSNSLAYFAPNQNGSGNYLPAHVLNIANGSVSNATASGFTSLGGGGVLYRSTDDKTVLIDDWDATYAPMRLYDMASGTLVANTLNSFSGNRTAAINANGTLVASTNYFYGTTVLNRQLQIVATGLVGGAVTFNPVQNEMYVWGYNSSFVSVYDTSTFAQKRTLNIDDTLGFSSYPQGSLSLMATSPDGKTLFVRTANGVRVLNVSSDPPPAPVLSASKGAINAGEIVTLTAQLPAGGDFWSGTVVFKSGSQMLGSAVLDANGVASFTTAALTAGSDSITALFQSDSGQSASSSPVVVTVNPAASTVALSLVQVGLPTAAPVMLARVSGLPGVMPTGSVDLYEGNALLATGTLANGEVRLAPGNALATGVHALTAIYHGDGYYAGSSSAAFNIDVERLATSTNLSLAEVAQISRPEVFHVNVSTVAAVRATGSVQLFDAGVLLGTWDYATTLREGVTLPVPLGAGSHTIKAVYGGDANYLGSSSGDLSVTVSKITTTTQLSTSILNARQGDAVTLTAMVLTGSGAATGNVSFFDGATLLGSGTVNNGVATLTMSVLSPGTHSLSAVYNGSADFLPSQSNSLTETITPVTIVDLLVLYTQAAGAAMFNIQSVISNAVAQNNLAMENSLIPVEIRVVDAEQISYMESGSYYADLTRLQNASDGYMDSAATLRQRYHADLVSLFVNGPSTTDTDGSLIGLGSELNSPGGDVNQAFTVLDAQEATNYVLAHELGHNFGARHDTQNDPDSGGFQTAHGYRFYGNSGVLYHDIMSYDPGQTIPYYSNPNVTYGGVPEGAANANAAATIAANAAVVANYSALLAPLSGATRPAGKIENATNGVVTGWGYDANAGSAPVMVRLDVDGKAGTPFAAKVSRTDLEPTLGSANHGFSFTLPASLSEGNHAVTLWVQDAPGTSYVQVDSKTVNVVKEPDLTVAVGKVVRPLSEYLPGDVITVPVTVKNVGAGALAASPAAAVAVDVRVWGGGKYNIAAALAKRVWLRSPLAAGKSITFNVTFVVTQAMGTGMLSITAMADAFSSVTELNELNNTAAAPQRVRVAWQFGAVAGRKGAASLVLNDADGTRVTMSLTGGGTGTVTNAANGFHVAVAGSNGKSALTFTTAKTPRAGDDGLFSLGGLTVGNANNAKDHTAIKTVIAPSTNLLGNVSIAGTAAAITLRDVAGPATLAIRSAGGSLALRLGMVQDLLINSAEVIGSVVAANWAGDNVSLSGITAPSLGSLTVTGSKPRHLAGDFSGNVTIRGALGKVTVAGQIGDGMWMVHGKRVRG